MTKVQKKPIQSKKIVEDVKMVVLPPSLFDIPETILPDEKRAYYPNWHNKPPKVKPIITAQNRTLLRAGGYMAIVSRAGMGKSAICEAICANIINPKNDCLGFDVKLPANRNKILYIDTERTIQDTWLSWERTMYRADINEPDTDNHIIFVNLKAIAVADRILYVTQILKDNSDVGLIIFDGAGDFVKDINSIDETTRFTDWINTFNPNVSQIITIHTNPTDDKPRGHLGSEILRRAESVLLLKKTDEYVREITTKFQYGKIRNDDDNLQMFFEWSDEYEMFLTSEYEQPKIKEQEKQDDLLLLVEKIFIGKKQMSYHKLTELIMSEKNVKIDRAKRIISLLINKHIKKVEKGTYERVYS